MRKILSSLVVVAISAAVAVAVIAPSPANAGRGGHRASSGSSSISLVEVTGSDSVPNWGEQITFNVSTTATNFPYVDLNCIQDGTTVYTATTGYFADYPWPWTQVMTLQSQAWTGGAADCTATLYYPTSKRIEVLATLPFHVDA
jgi:hypothetical protein